MPYIGTSPSNSVRRVHTYTATASQTTFTGASSEGVTLSYADTNYIDVFQNGVLLGSADYTSTSGTSVVLAQGASVDDLIVIVVYDVFSVADTVSKTNGGTFDGNVTVSGDLTVDTDTLKVDTTNDKVGINTASPSDYYSDELVVTAADEGGMTFVTGTTHANYISFADGTSGNAAYRGFLKYDHNNDKMTFGTSGSSAIEVDSTGAVTKPLQPAFMVNPSTTQSNIPINGLTTILFPTERFDQNSDFASNTFTAPVTGKYQLQVNMRLDQVDKDNNNIQLHIVTSNKTYYSIIQPAALNTDAAYWWLATAALADMDANDTAYIQIYISNDGTAQMDVDASSYFSGYLVA